MKPVQSNRITLRKPDDFHVHFRQGSDLPDYVQCSAQQFARALVMPNTSPAIADCASLHQYKHEILHSLSHSSEFTPLMTFKIYPDICAEEIHAMYTQEDAIAAKLYPQGVTTNAEDGVSDITKIFDVLSVLAELDMVLCIHGEDPHSFVLDREKNFLSSLHTIRENFPTLRIVLEHVSSKEAVEYVQSAQSDYLAATITIHHLLFSLDAVIGELLNPHMFCKPVLKTPQDLHAIQQVALEGNRAFFLGTDSAPHSVDKKECAQGCAGVFSAPVAMPLLTMFFEQHADTIPFRKGASHFGESAMWIRQLEQFSGQFGADFYRLPYNEQPLVLAHEPWQVPPQICGVVPLHANTQLVWNVIETP